MHYQRTMEGRDLRTGSDAAGHFIRPKVIGSREVASPQNILTLMPIHYQGITSRASREIMITPVVRPPAVPPAWPWCRNHRLETINHLTTTIIRSAPNLTNGQLRTAKRAMFQVPIILLWTHKISILEAYLLWIHQWLCRMDSRRYQRSRRKSTLCT